MKIIYTISKKYGKVAAMVDDSDYIWLSMFKWSYDGQYFNTWISKKKYGVPRAYCLPMQRLIMGMGPCSDDPRSCDHKDRNKKNYQRCNLRIATLSQNRANRTFKKNSKTGFIGVGYNLKWGGKYRSIISINGVKTHLGLFENIVDAAKAYDKKAIELFGEFAITNFPQEGLN